MTLVRSPPPPPPPVAYLVIVANILIHGIYIPFTQQKCDTWTSIARLHADAGHKSETVMEAYRKAAGFADESGHLKHQVYVL